MQSIPRQPYVRAMAWASAISLGLGAAAATYAGASTAALVAILSVLLIGVGLCVLPLMGPPLVTAERWGLVVLGVSAARTLLALGGMLVLIEGQGFDRRPVVFGLLTGSMVMILAEAVIAVRLLLMREHTRPHMNNNNRDLATGEREQRRDS